MREEPEREFNRIFRETSKLAKDLHGEEFVLSQPRVNRRQMHRGNIQASTAEEYFRITLYNEFSYNAVAKLQERLLDITSHGIGLLHLLPASAAAVMLRVRYQMSSLMWLISTSAMCLML